MLSNIRKILHCTLFTPKHQKRLSESFVNVEKVSETFASLEKSVGCDHGYSTKKHKQTNQINKQTNRSGWIWSNNLLATFHSTVPPFDLHLLLHFLPLLSSGPFCLLLQCHKLGEGKEGEVESLETIGCKRVESLCSSCPWMVMMMVLLCEHLWCVVWSVVWSVSDWWPNGDDAGAVWSVSDWPLVAEWWWWWWWCVISCDVSFDQLCDWWPSGDDDDGDGCVIRLSSIPCSGWYEGQRAHASCTFVRTSIHLYSLHTYKNI